MLDSKQGKLISSKSRRQKRTSGTCAMPSVSMYSSSTCLFVDNEFPPETGSLSYVYSGDDNYEKMQFKRPTELVSTPYLYGLGGICHVDIAWSRWKSDHWFRCALAVVSLDRKCMDKLIPGYAYFGQDFGINYKGFFRFRLWRFGEWKEHVIDDLLPTLNGRLPFCPSFGSPPEFWGALLEKACHKAYEAIELGNCVDAVRDLTGSICEHYDSSYSGLIPLFQLLQKSCQNRSLLVCWRSQHSFRCGDFKSQRRNYARNSIYDNSQICEHLPRSPDSHIYVITAITQFPLRDGTRQEVIRLKNPYINNTLWRGEFSIGNEVSWSRVSSIFMTTYKPKECRESNEFWMPFYEFRQHFGDVLISSGEEASGVCSGDSGGGVPSERRYQSVSRQKNARQQYPLVENGGVSCTVDEARDVLCDTRGASVDVTLRKNHIEVAECAKTNTVCTAESDYQNVMTIFARDSWPEVNDSGARQRVSTSTPPTVRSALIPRAKDDLFLAQRASFVYRPPSVTQRQNSSSGPVTSTEAIGHCSAHASGSFTASARSTGCTSATLYSNSDVATSINSDLSNTSNQSSRAGSMSDINIKVNGTEKRKAAKIWTSSLSGSSSTLNSIQGSMFEAKMDYFKPKGSWKEIVNCFDSWTKTSNGGPRTDMMSHNTNPRIAFTVSKTDAVPDTTMTSTSGSCHAIISVLQDYRDSEESSNALLVPLGFCIYKSKNLDRDEKRNLSRLTMVMESPCPKQSGHSTRSSSNNESSHLSAHNAANGLHSAPVSPSPHSRSCAANAHNAESCNSVARKHMHPSRDVTVRMMLEPGGYLLVPYTYRTSHRGRFLCTVLVEKDRPSCKTGCAVM